MLLHVITSGFLWTTDKHLVHMHCSLTHTRMRVHTWLEACSVTAVDIRAGCCRVLPGAHRIEQTAQLIKQLHLHTLRVEVVRNLCTRVSLPLLQFTFKSSPVPGILQYFHAPPLSAQSIPIGTYTTLRNRRRRRVVIIVWLSGTCIFDYLLCMHH